jgi:hypothetical protein
MIWLVLNGSSITTGLPLYSGTSTGYVSSKQKTPNPTLFVNLCRSLMALQVDNRGAGSVNPGDDPSRWGGNNDCDSD